ncbi:MAG: VOC family protein [Caulobacterales bacterium]
MPAPVVFFDIACPDLATQRAFYSTVFGWDIAADGSFTVPAASPMPGLMRVEAASGPLQERIVYLGVEDINTTLAKIQANGGSVVYPRSVVPGVVILAVFKDPAGNRTGLVEIKDGKPIVPPAK